MNAKQKLESEELKPSLKAGGKLKSSMTDEEGELKSSMTDQEGELKPSMRDGDNVKQSMKGGGNNG